MPPSAPQAARRGAARGAAWAALRGGPPVARAALRAAQLAARLVARPTAPQEFLPLAQQAGRQQVPAEALRGDPQEEVLGCLPPLAGRQVGQPAVPPGDLPGDLLAGALVDPQAALLEGQPVWAPLEDLREGLLAAWLLALPQALPGPQPVILRAVPQADPPGALRVDLQVVLQVVLLP